MINKNCEGLALTVWITTNCGKFRKKWQDHLTCLLRNLYAGQEATVTTGHGTTDWFQAGKRVHQGCILSPCLFNFYAEYIMRNAGLEEAQAGIKIARTSYLEKAMAPHSSTLAWKIPWTEDPGGPPSMGSLRVGHDWATSLSLFTFMHWRRKWQPTPVFLPRESQGRGSLVGCHLWGRRVGHDWSDLADLAAREHFMQRWAQ